jgi:CubicO group peptidase (beta-lactamase class C family)
MRFAKWFGAGLVLMAAWTGVLLFGATEGWFRRPIAPAGDARAFMEAAVGYLKADQPVNMAFMLVQDGQVFDSYYSGELGPDTLFPVASMSKWFTAYGVMTLVQAGKIDLDAPISTYLTRWKLPDGGFDGAQVTTRRLLSHTAGLDDGLGFADYAAAETVPEIVETLAHPRASSGEPVVIRVGRAPGSAFRYSGGSYLILQLLVEEVSGLSFDDYMEQAVFAPLGMTRSTYAFLGDRADTAASLTPKGEVAPFYRYAAAGATGLATTAGDLLRFVQAQVLPAEGNPLSRDNVQAMRATEASQLGAPLWGLGTVLYAPTRSGDFVFGHGGQNEPAINAEARLNPDTRDAILVLVTGDRSLATRLGFLWTFWQTGRPDVLAVPAELARVIPWLGLGLLVIVLATGIGFWRTRSTRRQKQTGAS